MESAFPASSGVYNGKNSDPVDYIKSLIVEIVFGWISMTFSIDSMDVNHLGHFGRLPWGSRS